jgi:hypothetical protein
MTDEGKREDCEWAEDDTPCADGPLRAVFNHDLDPWEFSPLPMCPAHAARVEREDESK